MAEDNSPFLFLPVEVKLYSMGDGEILRVHFFLLMKTKIFHKLDVNSTKSARLVCKTWSIILDFGWRPLKFYPVLRDDTLKYLLRCEKTYRKMEIHNLVTPLPISSRRNKLTQAVEKITLTDGISQNNIQKLLLNSKQMKKLNFRYLENELFDGISRMTTFWNHLTSLQMHFDNVDVSQSQFLERLSKLQFPCLQSTAFVWNPLSLKQRNIWVDNQKMQCFFKCYLFLHELIANCRMTLTSVRTDFRAIFQIQGSDFVTMDANLVEKHAAISKEIMNIPLNILNIYAFNQEGEFPWNLNDALIHSNHHDLVDIVLYNCELITEVDMELLIKSNEKTLKHLDIVSDYNQNLVTFNCSWLKGCVHLKSLGVDCYGSDTHVFRVLDITKIPTGITDLTLVTEWLPSYDDKVWIAGNLLKLHYLCMNIDGIFTQDLIVQGINIFEIANADNNHIEELDNNEHDNINDERYDIFPLKLFKKILRLPRLQYLTLIHSKGYDPGHLRQYCENNQWLEQIEHIYKLCNSFHIEIS